MEKPKKLIYFNRPEAYREMGVFVFGRVAIPVYILVSVFAILTSLALILGGVEAGMSNGQSMWTLFISLGLIALAILFIIGLGIVNLVKNSIKDIKKATRIEHGYEKDSRY